MSHRIAWILVLILVALGATMFVVLRSPQPVAGTGKPPVVPEEVQDVPDEVPAEVPGEVVVAKSNPKPPGEPTFVGRQACKECHAENFDLHAVHGHASTFARASETDFPKDFAGKSHDAGEPYGEYKYHSNDKGELFTTLEHKFGKEPFPLQYAVGSGHAAVTFLTLVPGPNKTTSGVEHRVTWYSDGQLDLTPGHAKKSPHEGFDFFGDTLHGAPLDKCVYCHTTTAKIVDQEIVDLVSNVNCEKCHGPASEHVKQARQSKTPPPFSVGREDWDAEAELQLCGDCHRLPKSITTKELREYPDLLARFQPIGLMRSKCYLESEGQLKCTTCHDPHTTIKVTSNAQQVSNCVSCHLEGSVDHVICPVSPSQGCIECHMRAVKQDVGSGFTFHDHWIRVFKDD